ncbi:MAG: PKD domain-containing protein [Bacteroidota bacterium]
MFGFIIALMGCYQGYHSGRGAQGVGRATTNAVVTASAAFGDDENVGTVSEPSFLFRNRPIDVPQFSKPELAEQMDTLDLPDDGSYLESQSAFVTCDAHVYTINGEGPCQYNGRDVYDKMFFREFSIGNTENGEGEFIEIVGTYYAKTDYPAIQLYSGHVSKAQLVGQDIRSTPANPIEPVDVELSNSDASCRLGTFTTSPTWRSNLDLCNPQKLPEGDYTIVYYAGGGSFDGVNPQEGYKRPIGVAGNDLRDFENTIRIRRISPDEALASTFNRTNNPSWQGDIYYELNRQTISAYPSYATAYPFERATINQCDPDLGDPGVHELPQKVVDEGYQWATYYTFSLRWESYAIFGGVEQGEVFPYWVNDGDGDGVPDQEGLTRLNNQDANDRDNPNNPLSPCGPNLEYCGMQPGQYTLVVYSDGQNSSVKPTLTVNKMQETRFDLVENTYDMGSIPGDGKPWFMNEEDFLSGNPAPGFPGRNWTNDFFTCRTGAFPDDPRHVNPAYPAELYPESYCWALGSTPGHYDLNQYPASENQQHFRTRKTLWYSFVIDGPGMVSVSVFNLTKGKGGLQPYDQSVAELLEDPNPFKIGELIQALYAGPGKQYPFAVYTDPVFDAIGDSEPMSLEEVFASPDFDPTQAGLDPGFITFNPRYNPLNKRCTTSAQTISWDIDPCGERRKRRYWVVVDNHDVMAPNSQVELAVTFNQIPEVVAENDFLEFAYNVTETQDPGFEQVLSEGTFAGPASSLNCASVDDFDRGSCSSRSVWYRFETDVAGKVRLNFNIQDFADFAQGIDPESGEVAQSITLYKANKEVPQAFMDNVRTPLGLSPSEITQLNDEILPLVDLTPVVVDGSNWVEGCLSPGVYYFTISCHPTVLQIKPRIQLIPEPGDICENPAIAFVENFNETVSLPLDITCHSWGGDFGEDGFTNTECFFADQALQDRKDPLKVQSSWYKFSVGDLEKVNLTFELEEYEGNNLEFNNLKYRVLTGTCGAMTSLGCAPEQTASWTLDCLPGNTDYYIQVVAPIETTGILTMAVTAEQPSENEETGETCTPQDFNQLFVDFANGSSCEGSELCFTNLSTQGESISYFWSFGDGEVSDETAPCHVYNGAGDYTVTLTAINNDRATDDPNYSAQIEKVITINEGINQEILISPLGELDPPTTYVGVPLSFSATLPADEDPSEYLFEWDFGNGITSDVQNPENIIYGEQDAGIRTVTLTVIGATCTSVVTKELEVSGVIPLVVSGIVTDASCFDVVDGAIDLTIEGGTEPFVIDWGISDEEDLAEIGPGSYEVTVTDASGQQATEVFEVISPDQLSFETIVTPVSCLGEINGAIDLTVYGGTAPYVVTWQGFTEGVEDIAELAAGEYLFTVTDANGCTLQGSQIVALFSSAIQTQIETSEVNCTGECVGSATLTVTGGTAPYSVVWADGFVGTSRQDLCEGQHFFTVTDATGCSQTQKVEISVGNEPTDNLPPTVDLCEGETYVLDAGNPGAVYLWSTGATTQQIEVSEPGNYSVQIANLGESETRACGVATNVVSFDQGLRRDGSVVPIWRSQPERALGQPSGEDDMDDHVALGMGGTLVLQFDPPITNYPGVDLKVFETTASNPKPEEQPEEAEVHVSEDGENFILIGVATPDHFPDANEFDIAAAGIDEARFVKLVDITDPNSILLEPDEAGFDVDGVLALNCSPDQVTICQFGPEAVHQNIYLDDSHYYLGQVNELGRPNYLDFEADYALSYIGHEASRIFPNGGDVPSTAPDLIAAGMEAELALTENSRVFVHFAYEMTGFESALGFYTYDLASPPQLPEDIDRRYIILPNASREGAGGELRSGDRINLGIFPANTGIGWFLVRDAWQGDGRMNLAMPTLYSNPELNPESDPSLKSHIAMAPFEEEGIVFIAFEEKIRDAEDYADDFNDLIFYTSTRPVAGDCMDTYERCFLESVVDVHQHKPPQIYLPDVVMKAEDEVAILTAGDPDLNYIWTPTNQTESSISVSEPGVYSVVAYDDNGCGSTQKEVRVANSCSDSGPHFLTGRLRVSGDWTTVSLPRTYASPVVVASPSYESVDLPAVVRIRNVSGNSFDIRLQNPSGEFIGETEVHYQVVEEGVYRSGIHGIKMEAHTFISTHTDRFSGNVWRGQTYDLAQTYQNLAVVGQVMSQNDEDWSVFWSRGKKASAAPTNGHLYIGKHVGEDFDTSRKNETLGFIAVEAGVHDDCGPIALLAATGEASVKGMGQSPAYIYETDWQIDNLNVQSGVLAMAGINSNNGVWPVIYGQDGIRAEELGLAVDEDQIRDDERTAPVQQVTFLLAASKLDWDPLEEPTLAGSARDQVSVVIFPNSSQDGIFNVKIEATNDEPIEELDNEMQIEVFGPNGAKLLHHRYQQYGDYKIDLSHRGQGFYFVRTTHAGVKEFHTILIK